MNNNKDEKNDLNVLYKDFAMKFKNLEAGLDILKVDLGELGESTYSLISKMKTKKDVLDKFRSSQTKTVPSSSFALTDVHIPVDQGSAEDLRALDKKIEDNIKHMNLIERNHLIPHIESWHKGCESLKKYIDQIHDAFEEDFKGF